MVNRLIPDRNLHFVNPHYIYYCIDETLDFAHFLFCLSSFLQICYWLRWYLKFFSAINSAIAIR